MELAWFEMDRTTPASAQRTWGWSYDRRGDADHPRVGGENVAGWAFGLTPTGPPPRRRGEQERLQA